MGTLWRWVKGHFPRLLKQILAWKGSTAMREKGHQNWPLVIRSRYDPHLPFPGRSVSRPWSKRDTSSSIPLLREMSVPHCPAAITSCEPGSSGQRRALSPDRRERRKRDATHIYKIIGRLGFRQNERKNCFRPRRVETRDTRKCFGSVTLLSERRSEVLWQGGQAMMLFRH